jgi:hypothetical protein
LLFILSLKTKIPISYAVRYWNPGSEHTHKCGVTTLIDSFSFFYRFIYFLLRVTYKYKYDLTYFTMLLCLHGRKIGYRFCSFCLPIYARFYTNDLLWIVNSWLPLRFSLTIISKPESWINIFNGINQSHRINSFMTYHRVCN